MFNRKTIKIIVSLLFGILSSYAAIALGADSIGTVASNISSTFTNIIKLITAGAYIGGTALTIASLFKFKQHKDNPQQVQLGTCMTMLLVGVALIFLPSIISVGGGTLGTSKTATIAGTSEVQNGT